MSRAFAAVVVVCAGSLLGGAASAQVQVLTPAEGEGVRVHVYASQKLALIQEEHRVPLRAGLNEVRFSWGDMVVDPLSVTAVVEGDARVIRTSLPAEARNTVAWWLEAPERQDAALGIAYLAEGLTAAPYYWLAADSIARTCSLEGRIELKNDAERDFDGAQFALVAGDVRLIDEISALAGAKPAAGPGPAPTPPPPSLPEGVPPTPPSPWVSPSLGGLPPAPLRPSGPVAKPSDRLPRTVFPLAGDLSLRNGETKRLPLLVGEAVPVAARYRYDPEKWGAQPHLLWTLRNEPPALGRLPLLDGDARIAQFAADGQRVLLTGAHMPAKKVGEEAELDLGGVPDVRVSRTLQSFRTSDIRTDRIGRVAGLDTHEHYRTEITHSTGQPALVEVVETVTGVWDVVTAHEYERKDDNKLIFRTEVAPLETAILTYEIVKHYGTRIPRK